jgi:hypothetical protein
MREFEFDIKNGETKYFRIKAEAIKESTKQEIEECAAYDQVIVQG